MIATLELKPEIERDLLTQAQQRGVSLADYLQEILSRQVSGAKSRVRKFSGEEWVKQFDEWADSFPEASPIPVVGQFENRTAQRGAKLASDACF